MTEAETGMMYAQVKEHQGLPATAEAKRKAGTNPPLVPSERFWTSSPNNCERINYYCFKLSILVILMTALGN